MEKQLFMISVTILLSHIIGTYLSLVEDNFHPIPPSDRLRCIIPYPVSRRSISLEQREETGPIKK